MSARSELRDAAAKLHYEISTQFGVSFTFNHRSGTDYTLYGVPTDVSVATDEDGGSLAETRKLSLSVPLQTGFAAATGEAEPVSLGDKVTYLSRTYYVTAFKPDTVGAIYKLELEEEKRLSSGVG